MARQVAVPVLIITKFFLILWQKIQAAVSNYAEHSKLKLIKGRKQAASGCENLKLT